MSLLVYISCSTSFYTLENKSLATLGTLSLANNIRTGLTGILFYCNGYFVQLLEGSDNELIATFRNIQADKRHENIEMISFEHGDKRIFPDWNMSLIEIRETETATKKRIDEIRLAFSQNPLMRCADALVQFIAP